MKTVGRLGMLVGALATTAACSAKKAETAYYAPSPVSGASMGYGGAPAAMDDYMEMEEAVALSSRGESAPRRAPKGAPPAPPPPPPPPGKPQGAPPEEPPPDEAPEAERMVHYEGYAQLRVANPVDLLDQVIAVAEAAGGRTERLYGQQVTVRVPVATFDDTWAKILALGDVMNKTVRADDVTDQFLAVDLRVSNLRTTRARLVDLLAKTTDENEKLQLLAQITRVTEELDQFESQLRTLSELAAMSRISVDAVAREAFAGSSQRPELSGFEWIRNLSPFNRAPWDDDKRVALPVPDGLVSLSRTGPFAAESADGVVLWTMRLANDPVGTAPFWIGSVEDRLADDFQNPGQRAVGGWYCLDLDQPGADEPYHWTVCARTTGNKLDVAQVYYPTPQTRERYGALVDAALVGGGDS